jgi:hypothetical protein
MVSVMRVRSMSATAAAVIALLGACSANSDGGSVSTGCDLLTDEEIEDSTGARPMRARPDALGNGCEWQYQRGVSGTALVLRVSPAESTRDGVPASTFDGLVENRRQNRIPVRARSGLGDEAVLTGGDPPNEVIVLYQDTVLTLTLNDLDRVGRSTMVDLMAQMLERDPSGLLG